MNQTNIYYYYLCNFIFKNNSSNDYNFNHLFNNLVFSNVIRLYLTFLKNINVLLKIRMKRYLSVLSILLRRLSIYKYFKKLHIKGLVSHFYSKYGDISYSKYINLIKSYICNNVNIFYNRSQIRYKFNKLYIQIRKMHSLCIRMRDILGYLSRYQWNYLLFYNILYIGLQHNYAIDPFYFNSNRLLYRYNNLLLNNRLSNNNFISVSRKIVKNRNKSKLFNINDNFVKLLSSKFNKGRSYLYVLFRSNKSNSRVTMVLNGEMFCDISCGMIGYKKSSRSSYLAANQLASTVSKVIQKIVYKSLHYRILKNRTLFRQKKIYRKRSKYKIDNRSLYSNKIYNNNKYKNHLLPVYAMNSLNSDNVLYESLVENNMKFKGIISNSFLNCGISHVLCKPKKYRLSNHINKYIVNMTDLNCLFSTRKYYCFKHIYHNRNLIKLKLGRSLHSIHSRTIPDIKIYLDYTGFGLGRKAAFKPINSGIYFLYRFLNNKRWKSNKYRFFFLKRYFHFFRNKKFIKDYKKKINVNSRYYHYYNNYKDSNFSGLFVLAKNNILDLLSILSTVKSIRNVYFIDYIRYELKLKYNMVKYIYIPLFYFIFNINKPLTNLYYLNFNIINFNKYKLLISNYAHNLKSYYVKFFVKIMFDLLFCFILFKLVRILGNNKFLIIFSIFNYFIRSYSILLQILKIYMDTNNVYNVNICCKLLSLFSSKHLNIYLPSIIYSNLLVTRLNKLNLSFSKLVSFNLTRTQYIISSIKHSIFMLVRLFNKLLYKRKYLNSSYINVKSYGSNNIPYNIRNIVSMLAKSISNPHNGCRPRRLRRK